jgi:hypothetical protein
MDYSTFNPTQLAALAKLHRQLAQCCDGLRASRTHVDREHWLNTIDTVQWAIKAIDQGEGEFS